MPKNSPEPDILPTYPTYPPIDGPLNDVPLDRPVGLAPVSIAKPWGREIWFTGMEARGESSVLVGQQSVALSRYLALAPERLCSNRPIVLLKILDPSPQPITGDLYFEVHDEKHEVYVVTNVDPAAWPDGKGAIRFGMNQQRRADFADDTQFRAAYLGAVKHFEALRRAADAGRADPAGEADARRTMESFTNLQPLVTGDVVVVPNWMPHALQHGVRVVEFQTPTYERLIISFAQKVLTQNHWDSERAIAHMSLEPPPPPELLEVAPGITQIAAFDDFSVWRIELDAGAKCTPPMSLPYAVCMNVAGGVTVNGRALEPEQACFVPGAALPLVLDNAFQHHSVSLVAAANP